MSWKKMFIGEKMPDKDDPKYREQYEQEVAAGRKFAQLTKIDKLAGKIQAFALNHKKAFLMIVFGFILASFGLNVYRIGKVYSLQKSPSTEVNQQETPSLHRKKIINNLHLIMPPPSDKDSQETSNQYKNDNGYTQED